VKTFNIVVHYKFKKKKALEKSKKHEKKKGKK